MSSKNIRVIIGSLAIGLTVGLLTVNTMAMQKISTPALAGSLFCALGKDGDAGPVKRMMTADVKTLWDQAVARNAEIAKAAPDEKPPLGDGIPIQAFPDHAPLCATGKISEQDQTATVDITRDIPGDPKAGWVDRLVLKREGDEWRIDDILFAPRVGGSLKKALKAVR